MQKEILEEKVYYYRNVIKDPKKLVETIEKTEMYEYGDSIKKWVEWTSCSGPMYLYGQEKLIAPTEEERKQASEDSDLGYIFHTINNAFYDVCKDYAESVGDPDEPFFYPAFNIKKYMAGTTMGAHFDQQEGDTRLRYSLVMYLNDDYEGGEISFIIKDPSGPLSTESADEDYEIAKNQGIIDIGLKPEAGSILIFPSSPPYHHTAHLVKSGFKYMVPTHWMHNKD